MADDHERQIREDLDLQTRYPEVSQFAILMRRECWENRHKGDQSVWRSCPPGTWSGEIAWHLCKLMAAIKDGNEVRIVEHAADIANGAMMCLDGLGLLVPAGEEGRE